MDYVFMSFSMHDQAFGTERGDLHAKRDVLNVEVHFVEKQSHDLRTFKLAMSPKTYGT